MRVLEAFQGRCPCMENSLRSNGVRFLFGLLVMSGVLVWGLQSLGLPRMAGDGRQAKGQSGLWNQLASFIRLDQLMQHLYPMSGVLQDTPYVWPTNTLRAATPTSSAYPGNETPVASITPAPTANPYPSPNLTTTAGATATRTPTPTASQVGAATLIPTRTLTPAARTVTPGGTPAATVTPLLTPTPGPSPTPTLSPTPSGTPTPLKPRTPFSPLLPVSDTDQFERAAGIPQFVVFFAYWDGASKAMAPILNELAYMYGNQIQFVFLDIDDPRVEPIQKDLRYKVQPEMYILDGGGKILEQWSGLVWQSTLDAVIKGVLNIP